MAHIEIREPTFYILSALATGPKHGYAIVKEVGEMSHHRITLRVGTLYSALERLTESNLVRIHGEEVVDGRLRRYYMLTDTGAGALRDEATKLAAASQQAIARLGTWTPSPALRGAWA